MGCCGGEEKNIEEFPFEKMESINNFKTEISEIITNKDNKDRKNIQKLSDLYNKASKKVKEYEEELKKLKKNKSNTGNFADNLIQGMDDDIKQLKEYSFTLSNLINNNQDENKPLNNNLINEDIKKTENEEVNISKTEEKISDINNRNGPKILKYFLNQNLTEKKNGDLEKNLIENKISKNNPIYYKKYLRRNKRSDIFNRKTPSTQNFKDGTQSDISEEKNKNLTNINFVFEEGQEINVKADKNEQILTVIEKISEQIGKFRNIEKLEFFNGNVNVTEKIKKGEIVSSFDFKDNNFILVKLIKESK